jgi:hypothetical protein
VLSGAKRAREPETAPASASSATSSSSSSMGLHIRAAPAGSTAAAAPSPFQRSSVRRSMIKSVVSPEARQHRRRMLAAQVRSGWWLIYICQMTLQFAAGQ